MQKKTADSKAFFYVDLQKARQEQLDSTESISSELRRRYEHLLTLLDSHVRVRTGESGVRFYGTSRNVAAVIPVIKFDLEGGATASPHNAPYGGVIKSDSIVNVLNQCMYEVPEVSVEEAISILESEVTAFTVRLSDDGQSYDVVEETIFRGKAMPMPYTDRALNKAIKDKYGYTPETVYLALEYSLFKIKEYGIEFQNGLGMHSPYSNDSINGYNYVKEFFDYMKRRKLFFTCEYSGNLAFPSSKMLFIDLDGRVEVRSSSFCGYEENDRLIGEDVHDLVGSIIESQVTGGYNIEHVFFESSEVAEEYGASMCDDYRCYRRHSRAVKRANAEYHNLVRKHGTQWKCPQDTPFTIGFEIEKEDGIMRDKYPYNDLFKETQWFKENDSSLFRGISYELASPVYNLMDDTLERDLDNFPQLKDLINGKYNAIVVPEYFEDEDGYEDDYLREFCESSGACEGERVQSCGGHINLGSSIYSPIQLFFGLKGFLPLLYSVYNLRVESSYSQAKPVYSYLNDNAHSSNNHSTALQIKDNVLEFRIVAAVRNVKNLIWRRDLFRIMVENINKSEQQVLRMMLNPRSLLHRHLRKVYKTDERFMKKCNDFVRFSESYNQVKLNPIDWSSVKCVNPDTQESHIDSEDGCE
jgi:hypothetical protein